MLAKHVVEGSNPSTRSLLEADGGVAAPDCESGVSKITCEFDSRLVAFTLIIPPATKRYERIWPTSETGGYQTPQG